MRVRTLVELLGGVVLVAALPGAAPAAAAGSALVAVVIDFGTGGPATTVTCVDLSGSPGASDADAVAAAMAARHLPGPGFNSSGLLCQIGGYPSSCVGRQQDPPYSYWAYFQGSAAGWSYANVGPASHAATPLSTVGFRYEAQGTGGPSDPAPAASADPAVDCPVALAPASTTTTAPPASLGAASRSGSTTTTAALGTTASTTTTTTTTRSSGPTTTVQAHERLAASAAASNGSNGSGGSGGSSAVPTLLAVGAFGLVAAGTGLLLRRRRRAA
jgi:hypothetical protein